MSIDISSIQSQLRATQGDSEQAKQQEIQRQQQEMKINSILHQLCTPEALERRLFFFSSQYINNFQNWNC